MTVGGASDQFIDGVVSDGLFAAIFATFFGLRSVQR